MKEEERTIKLAEFDIKYIDAISEVTVDMDPMKRNEIKFDEQSEFNDAFLKKHGIKENDTRYMSDDEINRLDSLTHEDICNTFRYIINNKKKWQFSF